MADKQETITDIIKKTRAEADYIEETARGSLKAGENYDGIAYTKSDLESALDLAETKRKEADRLEAAHKREVDVLNQRCAELNAEVAAKDEVIKRLNDAIAEDQRRKMATAENSSAVGSAAKLRDALVQVQKKIHYLIGSLNVPNSLVANRMEINGIINAALAPRDGEGRREVTLEIDEVDFDFITSILCRASLMFEQLGRSHDVCVANRDRYREDAKMAKQARQMMYEAKKGETK